jgi:hypothetical protein
MTELTKEQEAAFQKVWKRYEPIRIEEIEARKIFTAGLEAWADRDSYKRKADALDRLEKMAREQSESGYAVAFGYSMLKFEASIVPIPWQTISTATTLLEAIEKAQVSK